MPPTLLLHGTADRVVPFARVQSLHRQMSAAGAPVQMVTFPGAGHSFRPADLQRAHETAADFLERALTTRGGRDSLVAFRPY
jgi:dipeptidyl aminopeptidase/acylaminoacyl peptidase